MAFFIIVAIFQMICVVWLFRKYSSDYWLSMFMFVISTDYLSWMFNNEYGIIVQNDEKALYEKIKLLVARKDLLEHYKKQAEKRGIMFSIEKTVAEVERMLLSL